MAPSPFSPLPSRSILPRAASLTPSQGRTLDTLERVMSLMSLIGCVLLIVSFLSIKPLRNRSFNRLLFFAACGNIFTNVATFIGHSGIHGGDHSGLCKFQATLIQWFMPADGLWAFCMAVNVFLTFHTTKIDLDIRRFEKYYFILCFGVSAIPALTYLFLDVSRGTDFYGDAVLWCWISSKHDTLRIYTFYAPVWVTIVITMVLYALAGRAIYRGQIKNQRMKYALNDKAPRRSPSPTFSRPLPTRLGSVTKQTEISQVSEVLPSTHPEPEAAKRSTESITLADGRSSFSSDSPPTRDGYRAPSFETTATRVAAPAACAVDLGAHTKITTTVEAASTSFTSSASSGPYALARSNTPAPQLVTHPSLMHQRKDSQTNRGARTYALVAFSLYIIMLVTWVPSTANRVYGVVHADALNFGLNALASAVLPLQGFFNTCVYMFISRHELWKVFCQLRAKVTGAGGFGCKGAATAAGPDDGRLSPSSRRLSDVGVAEMARVERASRESRASMIMRAASPPAAKDGAEGAEEPPAKAHLPLHYWPLRSLTGNELFKEAVSEIV